MAVYQLTTQQGDLHFDRWRNVQVPFEDLPPTLSAESAMDALEASVEKQKQLAIPKSHTFEVVLMP
jgi:hypothetical protein